MKKTIANLLAATLIGSCATASPPRKAYEVTKDFTILLDTQENINKIYKGIGNANVKGFYLDFGSKEVIFVRYGEDGKPDFENLGHEVWHLKELGGKHHE